MLKLGENWFTSGLATYYEDDPSLDSEQTSVHVNIVVEGKTKISTSARLDPATPWVVLNAELNELIGFRTKRPNVELHTVSGLMKGSLERFPITLAAEHGKPLEIDATLFVCDDWNRGNFLGYSGFLQRFRFAVDPLLRQFHFGPPPVHSE